MAPNEISSPSRRAASRLGAGARRALATLGLAVLATAATAQGTAPRPGEPGAAPAGTVTTTTTTQAAPVTPPQQAPSSLVAGPLPPDPATAARPVIFGSQIFTGRFGNQSFSGFNPGYQIAVGDRIALRLWGAFTYDAVQPVDAQGNVFVPNVGPVRLAGVRNGELNAQFGQAIKRVYRANVGVYAALEAAQPVKAYVTGYVKAPGLYGGVSSDSVLSFIDKAGGIDPDRGSYLALELRRGGTTRARFNLYDFLLRGELPQVQIQDGDTLVVAPQQRTVTVRGEAQNPYVFEFADEGGLSAAQLLEYARPKPGATHLSIVRREGTERRSEYFPLSQLAGVRIQNGDEVSFTADRYPGTILVRVDGALASEHTLVLPYGTTLGDALKRVRTAPQADLGSLRLFRRSVIVQQREMLDTTLRSLETYALTARSPTAEAAELRTKEAQLILQYVERARKFEPKGQVVLPDLAAARGTTLEDGDVLFIPERSNLVLVSGEVLFPNALAYDAQAAARDYVKLVGGYTQNADTSKLMVIRSNGVVEEAGRGPLAPGDQVLALPRIDSKNIEVTRGITQIVYQIALGAAIALGL